MDSVTRKIVASVIVLAGLAACGDKVTTAPGTTVTVPTTTTVTSTTTGGGTAQVQSVTVSPANVSLNIGQTQPLVAVVNADAGIADRTVTWTSNNTTVADVDASGVVTAKSAGTAVISAKSKADVTKIGTATVVVGAIVQPTIQIAQVNQGGAPAPLGGIAGQLDVVLNVDPGNQAIKTVDLIINCGNGDVTVATQTISADKTGIDASAATAPITLSFNTAQLNADGTAKFLNGQCTVKSLLTTSSGTKITSQNSVQITLANASKYTYTYTINPPANSAVSTADGLVRQGGDATLSVTGVNYSTAGALKTINVTWLGKATTATAPAGSQTFSIVFPNDSTKTTGFGVCAANCTGIYQYATAAAAGEAAPIITSSIDANGNQSFAGTATTASLPLRIDNVSPTTPTANIAPPAGSNNYLNGSYNQIGATKITTPTDNAFASAQLTIQIGYAAPASFTPLVGGTAVGPMCSTTGLTMVNKISDIPQSTVNNAYSARVFVTDPLNNVRCSDLAVTGALPGTSFGIDKIAPQVAFGAGSVAANAKLATAAGNNFVAAPSDTGSGFNPAAPVKSVIVRNFYITPSAANCTFGTFTASDKSCVQAPQSGVIQVDNGTGLEGYFTITTNAVDQAGNVSAAAATRTVLVDATIPVVGAITQSPSPISPSGNPMLGSGTFSATATDNVDLASSKSQLAYGPNGTFAQASTSFGTTFDATLVQTGTASATIGNIYRGLQQTALNSSIFANSAAPSVTLRATDAKGNQSAVVPNTLVTLDSAGTNILTANNDSLIVKATNSAAFSLASGTSTLSAEVHTSTVNVPNQPFALVNFYYMNAAGELVFIGSQTAAAISDVPTAVNPANRRVYTYTLPGVTGAQLGGATGSVQIFAVGVNSTGDAVVNNPGSATSATPTITIVP